MLTEKTTEYKTASNEKRFKIDMIETNNHGFLPVPVWHDDRRSEYDLRRQAITNMKSRDTLNRVARMHIQRQGSIQGSDQPSTNQQEETVIDESPTETKNNDNTNDSNKKMLIII